MQAPCLASWKQGGLNQRSTSAQEAEEHTVPTLPCCRLDLPQVTQAGHIVPLHNLPGAQETSLPSPGANSSKETGPVSLQGNEVPSSWGGWSSQVKWT